MCDALSHVSVFIRIRCVAYDYDYKEKFIWSRYLSSFLLHISLVYLVSTSVVCGQKAHSFNTKHPHLQYIDVVVRKMDREMKKEDDERMKLKQKCEQINLFGIMSSCAYLAKFAKISLHTSRKRDRESARLDNVYVTLLHRQSYKKFPLALVENNNDWTH